MAELAPGTVFAGCRIEGVAGRGGMGVVYRALELSLGRPVALKVIAAGRAGDREFRERFQREARMAARIDHPHVVPLYAAGEAEGRMYLVMRYVHGTDLHRELAAGGALAPVRAVRIVAQVASALDAAHGAGLVHRDVKPANVLLGDGHVYLTDFGLTRLAAAETSVTESGQWMGTVDYASPEQLQGERCDARSDVYALGCVLFAALTGGPPYPRGTVPATMVAHLRGHIPRVSGVAGVPAAMDRVISRALAKSPDDRYLSTGDLARAAEAALHGEHATEEERSVARGRAAPPASSTAATVIEEAAGTLSRPENPRYGATPASDPGAGRRPVVDEQRPEGPTRHLGDPPAHEHPTRHLGDPPAHEDPTRHLGDPPAHEGPTRHLGDPPAHEGPTRHLGDPPAHEGPTRLLGDRPPHTRAPRLPVGDAAVLPPANGDGARTRRIAHEPAEAPARDAPKRRTARGPAAVPARGVPLRRRRRGTRRLALGLLLAGAVAATGGAVATLGQGEPPLVGPVDEDEVRAVLDRFAGAMAAENPRALQRTLAADASRVTPADRQDGRQAVVAEYRRQFAGTTFNGYELLDADVEGGDVGRAAARYSAPRQGESPITGSIVFDVVRERGRVRIALVAATPD